MVEEGEGEEAADEDGEEWDGVVFEGADGEVGDVGVVADAAGEEGGDGGGEEEGEW